MTACISPRCDQGEAGEGLALCVRCRDRMTKDIAELPALHEELALALTAAKRGEGKSRSKGLNLEPVVMEARAHIHAWLQGWCRIVAEEREVALPRIDRVDVLAPWLLEHVVWLAAQPYVDEALANLAETVAEGRRARQLMPVRRMYLDAPCTGQAEGPATEGGVEPKCPGHLVALLQDEGSARVSETVCDADGSHRWPADQWITMGRPWRRAMDEGAARALARAAGA